MDGEDDIDRGWIATARAKMPYALGVCGLLAWFALLYFMLRDVM